MEPTPEPGILVLESCHSTWLFDTTRGRFRRILKEPVAQSAPIATGWRPYYGLDNQAGSDSFTVMLNPEGTRLLRSWRHTNQCRQCDSARTGELPLPDLLASGH